MRSCAVTEAVATAVELGLSAAITVATGGTGPGCSSLR